PANARARVEDPRLSPRPVVASMERPRGDGAPAVVGIVEPRAGITVAQLAVLESGQRSLGAGTVTLLHPRLEGVVELGGARAGLAQARQRGALVLRRRDLPLGDRTREIRRFVVGELPLVVLLRDLRAELRAVTLLCRAKC